MQISKQNSPHWLVIYSLLLIVAIITTWFSQHSINRYWQQTYHTDSPLSLLNRYDIWRAGGTLQENIFIFFGLSPSIQAGQTERFSAPTQNVSHKQPPETMENQPLEEAPQIITEKITTPFEIQEAEEPSHSLPLSDNAVNPNPPLEENLQTEQKVSESNDKIILQAGDKVFFAGDSLMQGIAPHIQKQLKAQYNIHSINLSKQSTGLSYPSAFDWPATIEKTLKDTGNIKLLVMFLGPNDPWDFPNPSKPYGAYLKFQSPEWEQVYRQRIERIITTAEKNNTKIIWLEIPYMKKSRLNQQVGYINRVYHSQLQNKALWLPTADLLSGGENHYVDSIKINGKTTRLRSKDGIHFSPKGREFLADYVFGFIHYQP